MMDMRVSESSTVFAPYSEEKVLVGPPRASEVASVSAHVGPLILQHVREAPAAGQRVFSTAISTVSEGRRTATNSSAEGNANKDSYSGHLPVTSSTPRTGAGQSVVHQPALQLLAQGDHHVRRLMAPFGNNPRTALQAPPRQETSTLLQPRSSLPPQSAGAVLHTTQPMLSTPWLSRERPSASQPVQQEPDLVLQHRTSNLHTQHQGKTSWPAQLNQQTTAREIIPREMKKTTPQTTPVVASAQQQLSMAPAAPFASTTSATTAVKPASSTAVVAASSAQQSHSQEKFSRGVVVPATAPAGTTSLGHYNKSSGRKMWMNMNNIRTSENFNSLSRVVVQPASSTRYLYTPPVRASTSSTGNIKRKPPMTSAASSVDALSNAKMSGSGTVMQFLHDTEGLAWKLEHHRFREASAMPNPHDKSPILVTESEQLLLPMHERFLRVPKCASQVYILPDHIVTFDTHPRRATSQPPPPRPPPTTDGCLWVDSGSMWSLYQTEKGTAARHFVSKNGSDAEIQKVMGCFEDDFGFG